ncbi:MAG: CYTH and CHAD domain-containing protein [Candidatus Nanopelagicales bacterium]|nr:CYTH and CHAD domain-containing protein [Candidatus Nanopelagicales bacterium]MDZ4249052.1 CYTH and CHAD domain-containing protein [Candidatus Nanopelagicales bacterium]
MSESGGPPDLPFAGSDATAAHAAEPSTVREVEKKLRIHALFRLPQLAGSVEGLSAVEPQPTRDLLAVYHDTSDLRLFRWGITLRRREGGHDAGWHMKLPVDDEGQGVRDEIRLPLSAGEVGHVPAALSDIVIALTREAPLVPVAILRTERAPYLLSDASGEPTLELVDDTVSVLDADRVVARFREIEVEALTPEAATDPLLGRVVTYLTQFGAVPSTSSKAATALGPHASAPPDVMPPDTVTPSDAAGAAVRAHLARHVRRLLIQDVRVRRDSPDSVHQMRVAARRIRSGLRAFSPLVQEEWARHLRDELGWVAGELGAARDTEVMLQRLEDRAASLPHDEADLATSAIDKALRARLVDARAHALAALRSERHRQLLTELVEAVRSPRLTPESDKPCVDVLPPLVEKAWIRLAKDVRKLHIDSPAHPWHETRIAAKKARYAAEAVEPVFGRPAKRLATGLAEVTEVLGDHQDAYVAQMTLKELASDPDVDGPTGFAIGLLHSLEIEHEMSLRAEFRHLWPTMRRMHDETSLASG